MEKVSAKELREMKKSVPRGGRMQYLLEKGYTKSQARRAIEKLRGLPPRDSEGNFVVTKEFYEKRKAHLENKIELYAERTNKAKKLLQFLEVQYKNAQDNEDND